MSSFKSALSACGLSLSEAAEFLPARYDTVKKWAQGKNPPPQGVWEQLAELFERIQDAADYAADKMAVEGVEPRAWGNIEADTGLDPLPEGAARVAGAMALLMVVRAHE